MANSRAWRYPENFRRIAVERFKCCENIEVLAKELGAFDFPAPAVASQRSSVLGHRFASIPAMRRDQFDPALNQPLSQRVTVVTTVGDQAQRFLPRPPRVGSAAHADRRERCFRWLSSARNARQILSQTPCSSQSRSLRQQVAGEGNSSGKSCQRAPLRRIHKMPSSTLRSEARGRPPRRRERGRGSKGRIFSHWASVNRRPYRAISPPSALLLTLLL